MPSIYNHENACWGIRRSSCDMFNYDLNAEFKANKARELSCQSNLQTTTPSNVKFSVSSNGYYGYQPHQITNDSQVESNPDISMDVEDMETIPSNMSPFGCVSFRPDLQNNVLRRKRSMTEDSSDGPKRLRQEECAGGGWSLRRTRLGPSKVKFSDDDYESTTTQLLRKTHGCELYLFERTCDY